MLLKSPAKLNLFFRVLKKRSDGFHEIASLYQAISICDTLRISKSREDRLICNHPQVPLDTSNLILRAARLFREKTNIKQNFSFELEKNIPIQAGLGGGSSNAATALWGMNQITGLKVDVQTLSLWGGELGSDVSFFFSGGTAYCEGKGEKITRLNPLRESKQIWIAKPKQGLATPLVYEHLKLELLQKRDPQKALHQHLQKKPEYFNDLETSAFLLLPELASLKKDLFGLGFHQVTMTGSGTAFFCFGDVIQPHLSGIHFYPAEFLNVNVRESTGWYS